MSRKYKSVESGNTFVADKRWEDEGILKGCDLGPTGFFFSDDANVLKLWLKIVQLCTIHWKPLNCIL